MTQRYEPEDWNGILSALLSGPIVDKWREELESDTNPVIELWQLTMGIGVPLVLTESPPTRTSLLIRGIIDRDGGNPIAVPGEKPIGHLLTDLIHTIEISPDSLAVNKVTATIIVPETFMVRFSALENALEKFHVEQDDWHVRIDRLHPEELHHEKARVLTIKDAPIYELLDALRQGLRKKPQFGMDALCSLNGLQTPPPQGHHNQR